LNAIMVSTTHAGVLDSEDQRNANDPRWHNHYVSLAVDENSPCSQDPAVTSITFQSPGEVIVNKNKAVMSNLPSTFTGTNALTGAALTLSPGTNVQNVVSFVLEPIFESGILEAVCVTDITPADKVIKN
jgi:UDP-N-acetylmuramyl tripeptide synthase